MKIAAFDLSLTCTGWATAHNRHGTYHSTARGEQRLADVLGATAAIARNADLVLIEGYSYASPNRAHQIGELGGVIRLWLWGERRPRIIVPPARVKKYATGNGGAGKEQMLAEAVRRLGYDGHDHNEADALWLWTMAADWYGLLEGSPVPKAQRQVVDAIDWPDVL